MKLVKYCHLFTLSIVMLLNSATSVASDNAPKISSLEYLPALELYAKPLSREEATSLAEPIMLFWSEECLVPQRAKFYTEVMGDYKEACVLMPAWKRLQVLTQVLSVSSTSPIKFPENSPFHLLDLLQAGAWKKKINRTIINGIPQEGSAFAAEVIMTKIVIRKALAAIGRLSNHISKDPGNDAKVYIVPKLIQYIEGRTLLGGLLA